MIPANKHFVHEVTYAHVNLNTDLHVLFIMVKSLGAKIQASAETADDKVEVIKQP